MLFLNEVLYPQYELVSDSFESDNDSWSEIEQYFLISAVLMIAHRVYVVNFVTFDIFP